MESDPVGLNGGLNSYLYVIGSPIGSTDSLGLEVTMTCRTVTGFNLLGYSKPVHCAVFVWHWVIDPCTGKKTKKIDAQYSLPGGANAPTTDPNNDTFKNDRSTFNDPVGSTNYPISPPSGMSQDQFDSNVTNSGNNYSQGTYMPPGFGPNSNTAANNIILNGGGTPPQVPGAKYEYWGMHFETRRRALEAEFLHH